MPYRVGQTVPRDVRARVSFDLVDDPETTQARDEAERRGGPGGEPPPAPAVVDRYPAGMLLVRRDEPITPRSWRSSAQNTPPMSGPLSPTWRTAAARRCS